MRANAYLFVYGTLRRCRRHPKGRLLKGTEYAGPGRIKGRLFDLGAYPGAIVSPRRCECVRGELFRLVNPRATLARLDRYEGCARGRRGASEYVRGIVPVMLDGGRVVEAWCYLYQKPVLGLRVIPRGEYCPRSPARRETVMPAQEAGIGGGT